MAKSHVAGVAGLLTAVGIVAACGGGTSTVPDNTSGSSSTSSTTTSSSGAGSSSSTSSSGGAAACPTALPNGGACSPEGRECEYGDDPRTFCRTKAECTGGTWTITSAPRCEALPTATCPASRDAADGKDCTPTKAICDYQGSLCECTNCTKYPIERCEGPVTWRCEAPPAEPGCPAGRPRLGATCTTEGTLCVYGCESGESRQCKAGAWASASSPGGCPRSSRKVKTDVHYLSIDERKELASGARGLKLTTWRYTGRLDDGRTHVGYILEDAPASPSSNMKREEVDLYTYTSMTLALAQEQQRQIDELKREVEELKRRPR